MIFFKRPISAVVTFGLCTLIFTQQVNSGSGWFSLWSSSPPPPRYQSLTLEENQQLEKALREMEEKAKGEVIPLPAIPETISGPADLIHAKDLRDIVLPSREQEYKIVDQLSKQLLQEFIPVLIQRASNSASELNGHFSTVLSPSCIDRNKRISVEDQQRCAEVRERMMSLLIELSDQVTLVDFLEKKVSVGLNRRKRTEKQIAEKKRKVNQVIDQYERELE